MRSRLMAKPGLIVLALAIGSVLLFAAPVQAADQTPQ
jgi:hypothetical protein